MREPTKTELVFEDLRRAYWEIVNLRRYPRRFRIAFELYVFKSQQLTEAMRKEYKRNTGKKWQAAEFTGWNANTAAIKRIRNAALHGDPIQLEETVLSVYPNDPEVQHYQPLKERDIKRGYFIRSGHTLISAPFREEYISAHPGLPLVRKQVDDPKDINNYAFPVKEYVGYYINWRLLDIDLGAGATEHAEREAVRLVLKSFPSLARYMKFYEEKLEENMYDAFRPKVESEEAKAAREARLAELEFDDEGGFYLGGHHIRRLVSKIS